MEDIYSKIVILVEREIEEFKKGYPQYIRSIKRGDLFLSLPKQIIEVFSKGVFIKYGVEPDHNQLLKKFKEFKIVPNHEFSVVVYHQDWYLLNNPKMIRRTLLFNPLELSTNWYEQLVQRYERFVDPNSLVGT